MIAIRYLVRFATMLFPLLLFLICLELVVSNRSNHLGEKQRLISGQANMIDTLVLGTSHMLRVRPNVLSTCGFNLSNHAQDWHYDAALLELYGPKFPRLQKLVIEVAPFSFRYRMVGHDQAWRQGIYHKQLGLPYEGFLDYKDYLGAQAAITCYGARNSLCWCLNELFNTELFLSEASGLRVDGSMVDYEPAPADGLTKRTGIIRYKYYKSLCLERYRDECLADITSMLSWGQKRGIQTCVVSTPLHKNYSALESEEEIRERYQSITTLCNKYGATPLDYRLDSRFTDLDFYDIDHLNVQGSLKLSHILAADWPLRR